MRQKDLEVGALYQVVLTIDAPKVGLRERQGTPCRLVEIKVINRTSCTYLVRSELTGQTHTVFSGHAFVRRLDFTHGAGDVRRYVKKAARSLVATGEEFTCKYCGEAHTDRDTEAYCGMGMLIASRILKNVN